MEGTRDWLRELLDEVKRGLTRLYGARLRGVYLFGSYARGEAGAESDVDLLIVLDEVTRYFSETERASELISALSLAYDVSISCVFMSAASWSRGESPFLLTVRGDAIAA
ncbi:MAG TPA: nucleotidyltransferase domain-containing protein [Thermoanaerobaculia bacterium]|jgi:predicted nucleotidyltransferase